MVNALLRIRNLEMRGARGERILDGVDLEVYPGRWHFLTGPSGCGKTRLAEFVAGGRTEGGITSSGARLPREGEEEPTVLMVRQNAHMLFHPLFRMRRMVKDLARSWNIPIARFVEELSAVLEKLGIENTEGILGSYPFELSGGERQRLALSLPLVVRPKLVILDEALSNLDSEKREAFTALYRELTEEYGSALIITTHRAPEFKVSPSRLYIMHEGKIVERGEKEQLEQDPIEEISKELLQWYR